MTITSWLSEQIQDLDCHELWPQELLVGLLLLYQVFLLRNGRTDGVVWWTQTSNHGIREQCVGLF